ncbi:hypothetical protein C0J52_05509 [Blattella germanica]|nr:hypothetical protein C0J52_05509 [Blattella germanica]
MGSAVFSLSPSFLPLPLKREGGRANQEKKRRNGNTARLVEAGLACLAAETGGIALVTMASSFCTELVMRVKSKEAIWDPGNHFHKDRKYIRMLWQQMGEEMGVDGLRLKRKWKNMKDYYRNELRRLENGGYTSIWPYFDMLTFLKPTIGSYSSKGIPYEDTAYCEDPLECGGEASIQEAKPGPSLDDATGLKRAIEDEEGDVQDYGKRVEPEPPKDEAADGAGGVSEDNEDLLFFRSLLPDLRSLSPKKKMFAKLKIQEILFNVVYSEPDEEAILS